MCPSSLYWRAQMVRLQPKRPPKQSRLHESAIGHLAMALSKKS
jgi:hypothetical protein